MLEPWVNPSTGRSTCISNRRLKEVVQASSPIALSGDPIQYQINRTSKGWVVELVNNLGVVKKPDRPAVRDSQAVAHVQLKPAIKWSSAVEWKSRRILQKPTSIELAIGPGNSEFIEFIEKD